MRGKKPHRNTSALQLVDELRSIVSLQQGDCIKSPSDCYQRQMIYLSRATLTQKEQSSVQYTKLFLCDQNLLYA